MLENSEISLVIKYLYFGQTISVASQMSAEVICLSLRKAEISCQTVLGEKLKIKYCSIFFKPLK